MDLHGDRFASEQGQRRKGKRPVTKAFQSAPGRIRTPDPPLRRRPRRPRHSPRLPEPAYFGQVRRRDGGRVRRRSAALSRTQTRTKIIGARGPTRAPCNRRRPDRTALLGPFVADRLPSYEPFWRDMWMTGGRGEAPAWVMRAKQSPRADRSGKRPAARRGGRRRRLRTNLRRGGDGQAHVPWI